MKDTETKPQASMEFAKSLGFSQEEARKVLTSAMIKKEKKATKDNLCKQAKNGIAFVQAKEIYPTMKGKETPEDIYALMVINPLNNAPLEPLFKHKTFFKTLATLCKGSMLATAINAKLT